MSVVPCQSKAWLVLLHICAYSSVYVCVCVQGRLPTVQESMQVHTDKACLKINYTSKHKHKRTCSVTLACRTGRLLTVQKCAQVRRQILFFGARCRAGLVAC